MLQQEPLSTDEASFLYEAVDAENVAVAGYSMGGLGAVGLASSGDPRVKAMIGISPYVDDPAAASEILVPALFITGTADQTVLHDNVRKMFMKKNAH